MAVRNRLMVIAGAAMMAGCASTYETNYTSQDAEADAKLQDDYNDPDLTVPGRNKDPYASRIPRKDDD